MKPAKATINSKSDYGHPKGTIHRFLMAHHKPQIEDIQEHEENPKVGGLILYGENSQEIIPSGTPIRGYVTDIAFRKQFDKRGKLSNYIDVKIKEESSKKDEINNLPSILTFSPGSFFGAKILGLLNAADLSKNIELNFNTTLKGEKLGKLISKIDAVFPTIRPAEKFGEKLGEKLKPIWADGRVEMPIVEKKEGKLDLSSVNEITVATVFEIYGKLASIKNNLIRNEKQVISENKADLLDKNKSMLNENSTDNVQAERLRA